MNSKQWIALVAATLVISGTQIACTAWLINELDGKLEEVRQSQAGAISNLDGTLQQHFENLEGSLRRQ